MLTRSKRSLVLQKRFTEIFRKGLWGTVKSGPGSGRLATKPVREAICSVVENLFPTRAHIRFTDAPCGDMTWMPLLLSELTARYDYTLSYTGIDIVEEMILSNRSSLQNIPGLSYRFIHQDLVERAPPCSDIILCKDLVNHLCFSDIFRVLAGFNDSGSNYLLITSNRGHRNLDAKIMRGNQSRHVDLEGPPFLLPPPLWSDGYLALWPLPLPVNGRQIPQPAAGTL